MARHNHMPVTVAVGLTLAAGIAIVQEHIWSPAAAARAVANAATNGSVPSSQHNHALPIARSLRDGVPQRRAIDQAITGERQSVPSGKAMSVGSRALQGNDCD